MMWRCVALVLASAGIVLGLTPATAGTDDRQPKEWLKLMISSMQSRNYEGTFVYMHGDRVQTMHIVHAAGAKGQRERLLSLTGEAREIIRDHDKLTCIWPGMKSVVMEPRRNRIAFPATLPADAERTARYYDFENRGIRRVAGRHCQVVAILPQDDYRYGYRFCIDQEKGIPLTSEMLDLDGEAIERVMFTSISFPDAIPDSRFNPSRLRDDYEVYRAAEAAAPEALSPEPGWRVAETPPGFRMRVNTKRMMAASDSPVQHMIFTDGLASVSVFIAEPRAPDALEEGLTHSGAMHAYATAVDSHQITVMGEVPRATVEMIGGSVTYDPSTP